MIPHSARSHAQVARVRMIRMVSVEICRDIVLWKRNSPFICSQARAGVGGSWEVLNLFSLYIILLPGAFHTIETKYSSKTSWTVLLTIAHSS